MKRKKETSEIYIKRSFSIYAGNFYPDAEIYKLLKAIPNPEMYILFSLNVPVPLNPFVYIFDRIRRELYESSTCLSFSVKKAFNIDSLCLVSVNCGSFI